MTPVTPGLVPRAVVRAVRSMPEQVTPPRLVAVERVPSPTVVPRQIDPVGLRLMALMLENEELRSELDDLRSA